MRRAFEHGAHPPSLLEAIMWMREGCKWVKASNFLSIVTLYFLRGIHALYCIILYCFVL